MISSRVIRLSVACWLLLLGGCTTTGFLNFGKDDFPKAGPKNPAVQALALWQPSSGPGLDNRTGRGFAGQILFFTPKEAAPAKVDGTVRIYVYDDHGTPEEQVKPLHQFDYSPEAWAAHAHMGKLGLTYTVFVPYTREGSHEAHCSLRLRYTPREGQAIFSDVVNVTLPGRPKNKDGESNATDAADEADDDGPADSAVRTADVRKPASRVHRDAVQQIVAESAASVRSNPSKTSVPLSDAERERIIREARARLLGETDDVGDDQAASPARPRKRVTTKHILNDGEADPDDHSDDDAPSHAHRVKQTVRRQHLLSEEDDDDDEQIANAHASRSSSTTKKSKTARPSKRHLLEDQVPQESRTDGTRRRETLTLSLSGIR